MRQFSHPLTAPGAFVGGRDVEAVHFGGPERPRALRDLLAQRIEAVSPGGEINWLTYYFRDESLADALVRAHRRGVHVRVCVEGSPRVRHANRAVIARLSGSQTGIGPGLRVVQRGLFRHLHEKLFLFSDPCPTALVGSFNPSGREADDPAMIRRIGDQDRGHNLLVELRGDIVEQLAAHARALHDERSAVFRHFREEGASSMAVGDLQAFLFPRRDNPLVARLRRITSGGRLRIAASHLRDPSMARLLTALAGSGVKVQLLAEATQRRVPGYLERRLVAGGVEFRRYRHPDHLPMHCKFVLAECSGERWSAFGSFNLTRTSRWLNTELLMMSDNEHLFDALSALWDAMQAEMAIHARDA